MNDSEETNAPEVAETAQENVSPRGKGFGQPGRSVLRVIATLLATGITA